MFHSARAFAYQSVPVTIISGGEVAIMEVEARYDRQSITVSGKGFEIFPRQTCGYAQIVFVDGNGGFFFRRTFRTRLPTRTLKARECR